MPHQEHEPPLTVGVLRELLRNLQAWEALFEETHQAVLQGPGGVEYHLVDIRYLYSCRGLLSARQRQAIELCLYEDTREKDAALLMGVSPTNPVAMYATNGLVRLLEMVAAGMLPRYRHASGDPAQSLIEEEPSSPSQPLTEESGEQEGAA